MDYSQLSDSDLMNLIAINKQESSGAGPSSTVTNPSTGASGNMQVMSKTAGDPGYGVKPSNGTPEDTSRVGAEYYMALKQKYQDPTIAAMAYDWGPGNVDKWIKNGSDYSKVPDETLKYAIAHAQAPGVNGTINNPTPTPTYQSPEGFGGSTPLPDSQQRGQQFVNSLQPNPNLGAAVTGTGQAVASGMSGMFGGAAGALHGAADIVTGQGYNQARQDFLKEMDAATYTPGSEAGQQISQNLGEMFDKYDIQPMQAGAKAVMGAIPFVGEDLSKSPMANQVAEDVGSVVGNLAPMLLGGEGAVRAAERGRAPEAAAELDKMSNLDQQTAPAEAPVTPEAPAAEYNPPPAPYRQYFEQPSLFDEANQGEGIEGPQPASTEFNEANPTPDVRGGLSNARQFPLDLEGEPGAITVDSNGEAITPSQQTDVVPFRDIMQQRMDHMNNMSADQLGLFDSLDQHTFDQFGGDETPRTLAPDEFQQTVENLAAKDGTRFPMPEDMDQAYNSYLETVRDDQGGLFDRATIAKNFADNAAKEATDRMVNDHPIVKANQAKVDALEQAFAEAGGKAPKGYTALEDARRTLQKSKDNIAKFMGKDPTLPYEKDGVVNMFTFGNIPEMFKSIKAVLQGIHGVVFKTLDRALPNMRNLDTFKQQVAQGIKNYVNKEANRNWTQQVNQQARGQLSKVLGNKYIPFEAQDLSPEDLKAQMVSAPDIAPNYKYGFGANIMTPQQVSMFTNHPLVKYAMETVDRAARNTQQFVRQQLVNKGGLRDMARSMPEDELTGIWHMMQMNEGAREFTDAQLKGAGYSDKQVAFYRKFRDLQQVKLDNLNKGRAANGLPPVDARIGYIAGHFMGDFKQIIRDADGKVAAVTSHNLRGPLKVITQRVLDQLGEGYTAEPIQMRKLTEGNQNDRYMGYMNILNDMSGRDAVVNKVVQAYRDYMTGDAQNAMKYRAAFKSKEGVIGAEGRKSWESAKANAQEGIKNELRSQEAMTGWSNMADALSKISQFQTDPDIDAPNAKALVSKQLDNIQHRNQGPAAALANSMVNGIAEVTGVGPSAMKHITSVGKEGLLNMFIGLGKLSHSFVTLLQPLQGIPVVNSLMKAGGERLGLTQLTAALKAIGSHNDILGSFAKGNVISDPFVRKAMDFARDNDTLNTSQFQFGNLTDTGNGKSSAFWRGLKTAAEFNVTGMETATRSFTYMYYAHMLRDLGYSDQEAFAGAHNAMRDVMVDYSAHERPGAFGKLGFLGDLTAMLTRYKFNQIDQFARASRYAKEAWTERNVGKLGPLTTVLASSIAAAGVRGIMAYTIANKLVQATTTWAAENNLMDKPTSLDEILLHSLHGSNQHLANAVKFGMPSGLGLNMTGSLSHADDIPNDPIGALIPQGEPLTNMAKAIYQVARQPNSANVKTAAYDLAPNSMKGMLENKMFTDANGKFTNPHNYELQTVRTPADQTKRDFGFRPLNEANESLTSEVANAQKQSEGSVRQDITTKLLRTMDSNGGRASPEYWQQAIHKYTQNNGDYNELVAAALQHKGLGQNLTALQREQGIPRSGLSSIFNYERTEKLK